MAGLEPPCVVDAAVVVCLLGPANVGDDGWGASDAAALFKRLTMGCGSKRMKYSAEKIPNK